MKLKDVMDYVGVTKWHNLGYKGKGIKVLTCEREGKKHKEQVQTIIKTIAPECELDNMYWFGKKGDWIKFADVVDYAIENDFDIVEFSQSGDDEDVFKKALEKLLDAGIVFVNSSGNDGEDIEDTRDIIAKLDLGIEVGAITTENSYKPLTKKNYSNYGDQLDTVSFSGFEIPNLGSPNGTSFSAPVVAGQLALVMQFKKMNQEKAKKFISNNTIDLGTTGRDDYYGYGLFVLPDPKEVVTMEFKDIKGHWAEKDIIEVAEEGIISGYLDETFKPDNKITRAEMAVIVNRLLEVLRDV